MKRGEAGVAYNLFIHV